MTAESLHNIFFLLRRAQQIGDALFRHYTGIMPGQYTALEAIQRWPEMSQRQFVAATGIDRSTASALLGRLERQGLVKQLEHKNDGRARSLVITPQGADLLSRIKHQVFKATGAFMKPADRKAVATILTKVLKEHDDK